MGSDDSKPLTTFGGQGELCSCGVSKLCGGHEGRTVMQQRLEFDGLLSKEKLKYVYAIYLTEHKIFYIKRYGYTWIVD